MVIDWKRIIIALICISTWVGSAHAIEWVLDTSGYNIQTVVAYVLAFGSIVLACMLSGVFTIDLVHFSGNQIEKEKVDIWQFKLPDGVYIYTTGFVHVPTGIDIDGYWYWNGSAMSSINRENGLYHISGSYQLEKIQVYKDNLPEFDKE